MEVCCRRAEQSDAARIIEFNQRLASETEGKTLPPETICRGVERGLQRHPEVQYFVAEADGTVVGQLMFTREWSDWRDGWMLWLQSVYVDRDFRRRGVFQRLLEQSVQVLMNDEDVVGVRLYVERENDSAIAVYRQLGFRDAGYHIFERLVQESTI